MALDKPLKVDLESDLLIGGKFFSCISAIKADERKEIESRVSTVFEEMTKWSTFDESFKRQDAVSNDEFLVCVFQSRDFAEKTDGKENSLIYSRTVINDYFRGKTEKRKESGRKRQQTFTRNHPEAAKEHKETFFRIILRSEKASQEG